MVQVWNSYRLDEVKKLQKPNEAYEWQKGCEGTRLRELEDVFPLSQKRKSPELLQHTKTPGLGGGFKYVLFSTLLGEMIKFD